MNSKKLLIAESISFICRFSTFVYLCYQTAVTADARGFTYRFPVDF